ncbi:sugar fermentation stimulation protein [Aerococcus urinaehominis]|uniref:Sugar fermentation stimulation protein n=1 Tax=Aerococcus urinaehominis TaxID=128944 RepID=A0A0X8FLJ4_9LACT|nr:putative glycoside hydrolase [Aerococcus urinaehominis]AMB99524.1 sugar fermentation stimulation protein [Aerococcus urinaehominis]SDM33857.1 hypothetical protein SAMN04487985_1132 [Aerococcus urinaehominis]
MPQHKQVGPKLNWQLVTALIALVVILSIAIVAVKGDWFSQSTSQQTSQAASSQSSASQAVAEAQIDSNQLHINQASLLNRPHNLPQSLFYDSGVDIAYPADGVKGIYLSADGMADQTILDNNIRLLDQSGLNSVVIDVKTDYGSIATNLESDNQLVKDNIQATFSTQELMPLFEEKQIYPIARITTFKDGLVPESHPDWSFRNADGSIWTDASGQAFLNPYNKETWQYIVDISIAAAKAGFKDIQYDYVRFPEGFETFGASLVYNMGDYAEYGKDSTEAREKVIADFLAFAKSQLEPYGVHVSADIFGYVATVESTPGIGQNFKMIADNVDVISSMIYPSHWGPGYFGIDYPDLDPHGVVKEYMDAELALLNQLDNPPITRPWLQDFTADYLPEGQYINYGPDQVQAQIDALNEMGIHEYLLWDAANTYTEGVSYN